MKKSFVGLVGGKGLGGRISAILTGLAAVIGLGSRNESFNAPKDNPIRRSGKSSGGRGKSAITTPRYHSWKKCFGGLAVPAYQD